MTGLEKAHTAMVDYIFGNNDNDMRVLQASHKALAKAIRAFLQHHLENPELVAKVMLKDELEKDSQANVCEEVWDKEKEIYLFNTKSAINSLLKELEK